MLGGTGILLALASGMFENQEREDCDFSGLGDRFWQVGIRDGNEHTHCKNYQVCLTFYLAHSKSSYEQLLLLLSQPKVSIEHNYDSRLSASIAFRLLNGASCKHSTARPFSSHWLYNHQSSINLQPF